MSPSLMSSTGLCAEKEKLSMNVIDNYDRMAILAANGWHLKQ